MRKNRKTTDDHILEEKLRTAKGPSEVGIILGYIRKPHSRHEDARFTISIRIGKSNQGSSFVLGPNLNRGNRYVDYSDFKRRVRELKHKFNNLGIDVSVEHTREFSRWFQRTRKKWSEEEQ